MKKVNLCSWCTFSILSYLSRSPPNGRIRHKAVFRMDPDAGTQPRHARRLQKCLGLRQHLTKKVRLWRRAITPPGELSLEWWPPEILGGSASWRKCWACPALTFDSLDRVTPNLISRLPHLTTVSKVFMRKGTYPLMFIGTVYNITTQANSGKCFLIHLYYNEACLILTSGTLPNS